MAELGKAIEVVEVACPITMLKLAALEVKPPLTVVIVKFDVPAVVGFPEITPVLVLRLKPAGKVPEATSQVPYVPFPPVAARVCEYPDVPTVPSAKVVVVTFKVVKLITDP